MKNYKTNSELLNWPWVESPFFNDLIKNSDLTEEEKEIAIKFNKDGYVVLDLGLSDEEIEELKNEIDMLNDQDNAVTQAGEYHYSKGKRIFEGWRESKILQSLSLNEKVLNVLKMLYKKEPYPFQTIT